MSEENNAINGARILVVDDTAANLQLLNKILSGQGYTVHPASDGELALSFVQTITPDLILLDINMPGMDGFEVCRQLKANEKTSSIPIIFISILEDEHDKVKGLQSGGVDYITKPFQPEEVLARVKIHLRLQRLTMQLEQEVQARTNELAQTNQRLQQELSERIKAEKLLRESEERYRMVFENSPVSIWEEDFSGIKNLFDKLRKDGVNDLETYLNQNPDVLKHCAEMVKIVDVNKAALTLHQTGTKADLLNGVVNTFTPESYATFKQELIYLWKGITGKALDAVVKTLNGDLRNVNVYFCACPGARETMSRILVSLIDITEQKKLEEQLRQSQKLEAVGQLAGGIAHDFNNILAVIIGYAEVALRKISNQDPLREYIMQIKLAAERSEEITRQLLAFARKQSIEPKVLPLNQIIAGMLKLLRRLIGEAIELIWLPTEDLHPVKMDPSQIDQILANLCVNAKDAIVGVGKITIETHNLNLTDSSEAEKHGVETGNYVVLSVSDNGTGMDKETMKKIFDPFFTTKEIGKGTGLGLATVYGIVKQNCGFIDVYSEPSHGTSFNIYLPAVATENKGIHRKTSADSSTCHGSETILLVEDDPVLLDLTRMMLESYGYNVLTASTPADAFNLAQEKAGKIDLLFTDVIMPGMTGKDLVKQLESICPNLQFLFMSGYTSNVIAHQGVIDDGINFIQKPFSMEKMAEKVRQVLDKA